MSHWRTRISPDFIRIHRATPNALVATVNRERMPVMLTRAEEFDTWMRGPAQVATALAREHPPEQMQIVQTSYEKEDALVLGSASDARPERLL